MGTAIKHPVSNRVKLPFVIFDTWTLWRSWLSVRVPRCQKWRLYPVWQRMLYSCTHMSTVGVQGSNTGGDIKQFLFTTSLCSTVRPLRPQECTSVMSDPDNQMWETNW